MRFASSALLPVLLLWGIAPTAAQSLDGSLNSTLFGNLNGGLQSGFSGRIEGGLGPASPRTPAVTTSDRLVEDPYQDLTRRRELERQGFDLFTCAPTQIDRNRTGCRPIREVLGTPPSNYDLSIQSMGPLGGLTLQGQSLSPGAGPAGPLD